MLKLSQSLSVLCLLLFGFITGAFAQDNGRQRFESADSEGVKAFRDGKTIYLELASAETKSLQLPRIAAPLVTVRWEEISKQDDPSTSTTSAFKVQPEPEHWIISWENRPTGATTVAVQLADKPQLLKELAPVKASGDGSFFLPAHFATTSGEKIRYEPQTYKNTVGYWVGKQDQASWTIDVDTPGRFNVAILQGCGEGQGGSQAKIALSKIPEGGDAIATDGNELEPKEVASLAFEVRETGHFQNFQWRHLGECNIPAAGQLTVSVTPIAIKKNALMDIRAIHLIRLPAVSTRR